MCTAQYLSLNFVPVTHLMDFLVNSALSHTIKRAILDLASIYTLMYILENDFSKFNEICEWICFISEKTFLNL